MSNVKYSKNGMNSKGQQNRGEKPQKPNRQKRRQQPRKDSSVKRVNYDNARQDKVAQQIMKDAKSGKFNDINDFLRNPTLLKAAASYPVFPILGSKYGTGANSVPGIMVFEWVPLFGTYQFGPSSKNVGAKKLELSSPPIALNQAADSTYSFQVHANSRNYNYNSADLFVLILAGSQVFALIEAMKRAYGVAKLYTETNAFYPDALLAAMGFDPADLRHNLGQAWFDINNLIVQTRQIWVPNAFPIVTRWMDINTNIYKDAPGDYSQTYVYTQRKYYAYDEMGASTGGRLVPATYDLQWEGSSPAPSDATFTPSAYNNYKWSTWVKVCQRMIDALINSEDRGIIYGDLLNAYTAERIIAIPEMSSDYTVIPEYSPEISMQIENTIVVNERFCSPTGVAQYENELYPTFTVTGDTTKAPTGMPLSGILNFHVESDPTPEMILTATRFHSLGLKAAKVLTFDDEGTPTSANAWVPHVAGSEIVVNISVGLFEAGFNKSQTIPDWEYFNHTSLDVTTTEEERRKLLHLWAFDWAPFVYSVSKTTYPYAPAAADASAGQVAIEEMIEAFGDFDRYGISSAELLTKINDVAWYSLFGVPQI